MDNIKDALLRMARAGKMALELDEKMADCGFGSSPFGLLYGEISDAIYHLIGEHTETFNDSVTYTVLHAPFLYDERRAEMLYGVYKKNFETEPATVEQPKPNTVTVKDLEDIYNRNGGYRHTPEGEWQ